jgi:hypothetical protein
MEVERVVSELKRARRAGTRERMMEILHNTDTKIESLKEDIDLIIGTVDSEYRTRCLLNRIEQEYEYQRDNRSGDLLSEYRTPFRMWTSREIHKVIL